MLRNRFLIGWNGAVRRGSKNIIEIKNVEIVSENQEKSKEVKTSFSKTEIQGEFPNFYNIEKKVFGKLEFGFPNTFSNIGK